MIEKIKQNRLALFFLSALVLYLSWFLSYEFVIKPHTLLDEKLISNIVFLSSNFLGFFGHEVYYSTADIEMQMVGIDGSHPVWIGGPCNAITLMALFSIFVIAFPGPFKSKLWFIPVGCIAIHVINILRVCALALIAFYSPSSLQVNHTYTFTILVYGFIFLLWIIWVNRFSVIGNETKK